jgi:hypothetical protein
MADVPPPTQDKAGRARPAFWEQGFDAVRPVSLLEFGGIAVFLISAIVGLVTLGVAGTSPASLYQQEPWIWLRTSDTFFRIAAVGILVGLVARTSNAYVNIFGVLVIGALIIPTKDIMGFVAFFRDDSERLSQIYEADTSAAEYLGTDVQLAREIIATLENSGEEVTVPEPAELINPFDNRETSSTDRRETSSTDELRQIISNLSPDGRQWLQGQILNGANNYRVSTAAERIRLAEAETLLEALYLNRIQEHTYETNDREALDRALRFLKREGAITYPETSPISAEPTIFGCLVVEHLGRSTGRFVQATAEFRARNSDLEIFEGRWYPAEMLSAARKQGAGDQLNDLASVHHVCEVQRLPEWRGRPQDDSDIFLTSGEARILRACQESATQVQATVDFGADAQPVEFRPPHVFFELQSQPNPIPSIITLNAVTSGEEARVADPVLYLLRRNTPEACEIVQFNDDYEDYDSAIEFTPSPQETYWVAAREFSDTSAQMTLSYRALENDQYEDSGADTNSNAPQP